MNTNQNKIEWMFTFTDGGWNSIFANNKTVAIQLAKEKYGHLQINKHSFMVVEQNQEVYKNYLNSFN